MRAVQSAISLLHRFKNSLFSILAGLPLQQRRLQVKSRKFFSKYSPGSHEYNLFLAFEAFFGEPIYATHEKYFEPIENLRRKLLQDTSVITRQDYGAGLSKNLYKRRKTTSVAKLCKGSSMPVKLARLLFEIVYHTKPQKCLELGTCLGISGAYLASAQKLVAKNGRFVTIEGDATSAGIAQSNFKKLQLNNVDVENGIFADVLPKVLKSAGRINFALIDGHHNGPATLQYYEQIKPYLAEHAVLVFDDIDWSAGMQQAWETLSIFPEMYICIDLGRTGICMFSTGNLPKQQLLLQL